ncbi:MAG TPA: DJ-1/PfpI family protein [Flavisolibacter sp.]
MVSCKPIREFRRIPGFSGTVTTDTPVPAFDANRKTVAIIAHNMGTEIFDLVAPFYMFNLTEQANVYILAPEKKPIALAHGFFTMPHYTFREFDSLALPADIVVIPNLSAVPKDRQDPAIVQWIRDHYKDSTKLLSICAGSFTAAATGLYDQQPMTTHATDMKKNRELFPSPAWVTGTTYTRAGNLYSTAGVSNAADGSLAVIRDVFGEGTMKKVMEDIRYPHDSLVTRHESRVVGTGNRRDILANVFFKKNPDVAVLLQDGIDEFRLSAVLDAYHRMFPSTLHTYSMRAEGVTGRFGMRILPTNDLSSIAGTDEIHVLSPATLTAAEKEVISGITVVSYDPQSDRYIFDIALDRIRTKYGNRMHTVVKRLLDYN